MTGNAYSQNEDVLDNFTATEFNGNLLLNWVITQGNTCNGIDILHSFDSINFTQIGDIEGICGSAEETIYYDFTHSAIEANTTHFYKLQLGGLGFSWIIKADVYDFGDDNFRLGSNPLGYESKLQVENQNHLALTLQIFDLHGKFLRMSETSNNFFILSKQDYSVGKYLFIVSNSGNSKNIKGEFIVE